MNNEPPHRRNRENFTAFHALQSEFTHWLAARPGAVRTWLATLPARSVRGETIDPCDGPGVRDGSGRSSGRQGRTSRLSLARRRHLRALIEGAESEPAGLEALAAFLLGALPVCTYFEIADSAPAAIPDAEDFCERLRRQRESLLMNNYGLAQTAARQWSRSNPEEYLGAACCGLLDAIDRYVAGEGAACFSYFASYWIRYRIGRHAHKNASLVAFPINQHRIGRRINRYLAGRSCSGLPAPSEAELCADLRLGASAFRRQQLKPSMVSLDPMPGPEPCGAPPEYSLCDPSPGPAELVEEADNAERLVAVLRATLSPAIRVMLAYAMNVGSLGEAACDYLAHVHQTARERILPPSRAILSGFPACGIACDPASPGRRDAGNP